MVDPSVPAIAGSIPIRPHRARRGAHASDRTLDGLTALVVDDEPSSRQAVRAVLEACGARVLVARDGREALAILSAGPSDVVLCDLRMPVMDGFELIRRLRAEPAHARLRVYALTALAQPHDYLQTLAAGFDGHLAKPVEWDRLVRVLSGERRRSDRQSAPRPPRAGRRVRPASTPRPRSSRATSRFQ